MFQHRTPINRLLNMKLLAGSKAVEATATGNPLTFLTDLAKPLKSLLIPFTPQQEGTGDPSPQNIRPLLPWNGLTVFGGGKNLFDASAVVRRDRFLLNDEGVEQPTSSSGYTLNRTKVKAGAVYTISGTIVKGSESCRLYFYNGDTFVSRTSGINVGSIPYTFTVPQNCDGIAIQYNMGTVDFSTIQLEAGSTATAYEPYHPITSTDIVFPSPVYGGTPDIISGRMLVEFVSLTKTWGDFSNKTLLGDNTRGTLNISSNPSKPSIAAVDAKCNIAPWNTGWSTDSVHFYTNEGSCIVFLPNDTDASTEIQVVYPLATPQEITLTPEQITAIKGSNTMWSDADGSMTAVYLKKG